MITTGDLRSESANDFWGKACIFERLDAEGLPILISGWPCDGDSAQNRLANGLAHSSTALLFDIGRVVQAVVEYMDTPRETSYPPVNVFLRRQRTV